MYHTPPHPFHPHPHPHPAAGAMFPPSPQYPHSHHQAMESGPPPHPPHLFNQHYLDQQHPHHARHDSHHSSLSSSNFSTTPVLPLPPHVVRHGDLLPYPQMPMAMPTMGGGSTSPSPPSMMPPPHMRRDHSAPYMQQAPPPSMPQPVLYSSPTPPDHGRMMPHQHHAPPPAPLLPPLLPQFAHPPPHHQLPYNPQAMESHHHHPHSHLSQARYSSSGGPMPAIEGETGDRSRVPSGPMMMHSLPQMQNQQIQSVPPSFGTCDPAYSPTSPMLPVPQHQLPRPHTHVGQNEAEHATSASSAIASPRQTKHYVQASTSTSAINHSSPTYPRRGSLLRNANEGSEGFPPSKRNYPQRTPTKQRRIYNNNINTNPNSNDQHHQSYQNQEQNMIPSSPFYGNEMSNSNRSAGQSYRSYGTRRASMASSGSTAAATTGYGQDHARLGSHSPVKEFPTRRMSRSWKGYEDGTTQGAATGELKFQKDADVANASIGDPGHSNEAANWEANASLDPSNMSHDNNIEEEQNYLQYRVCMNPSCPNVFHYTQQIYQPITTPLAQSPHAEASRRKGYPTNASTTIFTLVDVPCMIQPPAWCELNPCSWQYEAIKIFTCVNCGTEVREFGPVNEEVQNVVESGKALFFENYEDTQHYPQGETSFDASYAPQENVGESSVTGGGGVVGVPSGSSSAPRIVFDGFQSAQDLISGHSGPSKHFFTTDHAMNNSEYSSSISNTTSPLLQSPSKTVIRYAKSDPSPSLPSLSPLILPQDLISQDVEKSPARQGNETSVVSKRDFTAEASIAFPTLSKIEVVSLPDRKISTSTVNTTTSFDSPVFETPDLGASSSSSASTSALNSPVALYSPVMTTEALQPQTPWRQKAAPTFYDSKKDSRKGAEFDRDAKIEQDFAKLAVLAKKAEEAKEASGSFTGLGLTFGTVTAPSGGSRVVESANTPTKARLQDTQGTSVVHSPTSNAAAPVQPLQTPKTQAVAPIYDRISPPHKMPPPTPRSIHASKIDSTSPTSHIKNRHASQHAPDGMTPSRPSRGRGRGRGRGGFAGHPQISTPTHAENHAHKPSYSTVSFGSIRSRTDTQSSAQTTTSSSSSSHGGSSHQLHNRKVSMGENRSRKLPELLANPTEEMKFAWEENKKKWWRDPWNGKLLGVKQKLVGAEKSMVRTDGSPLIKGRGGGISWPILKIHNIHFRTTIADIEAFVPPGVLAPLEHNAQGIHILCDAADGKTRPYAYVECISAQAAEHLVAVSEGKYLAGRQVAFRPVTQKELVLDLYQHLRKGGYYKDTILQEDLTRSGGSNHQRQLSLCENAGDLDLFTEQDDEQSRRLFDVALGDAAGDDCARDTTEADTWDLTDSAMLFPFPTERPFARLASMIVKFPCHAIVGPARTSEKHVQTVDRMFACLLYAMHKMAPYVNERPSLRATLDRLYCAGLQCPAFDERKGDLDTIWAQTTKAEAL